MAGRYSDRACLQLNICIEHVSKTQMSLQQHVQMYIIINVMESWEDIVR